MSTSTITKGDNWMRLLKGEMPEYVPVYDMGWGVRIPAMRGTVNEDGSGRDIFGVERVIDSAGILPPMPKTHDFMLTDITKWRDVVKVPDFSGLDWAAMAKEAKDARNPEAPWGGGAGFGVFQTLMALMGFTEGLTACFEEPEEVKELLSYLTDFMVDNAKRFLEHYRPEFATYGDDIAHERNPFLSLPMFQDIIAPCWRRYYEVFASEGIPCTMHNCGHFEEYVDDIVDMGVWFWEPAQSTNDLLALKAKYGRRLAVCEGFEVRFLSDDLNEEEVRAMYRARIDEMAPGGGYCIFDFHPEALGSWAPREVELFTWTWDEFNKIRYSYY